MWIALTSNDKFPCYKLKHNMRISLRSPPRVLNIPLVLVNTTLRGHHIQNLYERERERERKRESKRERYT